MARTVNSWLSLRRQLLAAQREIDRLKAERKQLEADCMLPVDLRGDGPCADCGTLDNIVWFTDNVFWNAVTGEDVVHEESHGAILCIRCFVARAREAGLKPTGWRLIPEFPWTVEASNQTLEPRS